MSDNGNAVNYEIWCDQLHAELTALRAEIAIYKGSLQSLNEQLAEKDKEIEAIDNCLRGNVCDPEPLKPLWNGCLVETTTYGLVVGLLREKNKLFNDLNKKCHEMIMLNSRISELKSEVEFRDKWLNQWQLKAKEAIDRAEKAEAENAEQKEMLMGIVDSVLSSGVMINDSTPNGAGSLVSTEPTPLNMVDSLVSQFSRLQSELAAAKQENAELRESLRSIDDRRIEK